MFDRFHRATVTVDRDRPRPGHCRCSRPFHRGRVGDRHRRPGRRTPRGLVAKGTGSQGKAPATRRTARRLCSLTLFVLHVGVQVGPYRGHHGSCAATEGGATVSDRIPAAPADVLSPPLEDLDTREIASPPTHRAWRIRWSRLPIHRRRRRTLAVVATGFGSPLPLACHLAGERAHQPRPGHLSGSACGRVVPWPRRGVHRRLDGERVVFPPPAQVGAHTCGRSDSYAESRRPCTTTRRHGLAPAVAVAHRSRSPAPPVAGEGQWSPVGRLVVWLAGGLRNHAPSGCRPYELRGCGGVDGHRTVESNVVLGEPDPGWWPVHPHGARSPGLMPTVLVAAFNAGFLMSDANGGYYTDNKTVRAFTDWKQLRSWSARTALHCRLSRGAM